MARGKSTEDLSTLQMALVGYQIEKQRIEDKIREIQAMLKGKTASSPASTEPKATGGKRVLSAAARRRISAAQKKRWAAHRKSTKAAKQA
ncbi:MAG: hypothetical protein NTW28_27820 [Candidatus Solibacter sp.]|nr:hypothetical protein [Candidatus Solibacter sp.]